MARLTDEQRRAVDLSETSVVLSAGAGCGKTTVLTERFIQALSLEGGISLDRVVVLTFTDKAAAELRSRVRRACREKLAEGEDTEYWRGVLRGLEAAPIGTFHNQFGGILRRHAVWAGVDPEFDVLDDVIAKTLREQSVDACLREALSTSDLNLRELAVEHGLDRVRDALIALLSHRSSRAFPTWASRKPEEVVEIWRAVFDRETRPALIDGFRGKIAFALPLLEQNTLGFHKVMHERRNALLDLISDAVAREPSIEMLQEMNEAARVQGVTAKSWPNQDLYETFKNTFEKLRDAIKSCVKSLEFDESASIAGADHGIRFARLAARAMEHYTSVKADRSALDFDDLLLRTLDLVSSQTTAVRAELIRRFDLILVDEFQDTDPVQDQIIRLIAGDDYADGKLFIVGDFKQSIYGFRGAEPELFAAYRHEFQPEACLPLSVNFRSRPGVIEFVNATFEGEFHDDYQPLKAGRADDLDDHVAPVVFAWPAPAGEFLDERGSKVDAKRQEEAKRLARLIRHWIDEERPVFDPARKLVRPMHGGDVAILFRTQNSFAAYEHALAREGLDFYAVGGLAFYAQAEVQDIINVLSVIDDPNDMLALAGSLRGPFFRLSDEALFWLASVEHGNLAAGLAHCEQATLPLLGDEDRRRAGNAHEQLVEWRSLKDRVPIAQIVERVVKESGFEAALLGEFLGDRKRANVGKLIRIARKYDQEPGFTLADFVARLKADRDRPPREEQAGTTDEMGVSVRLMTIHKAKGLEFPVVILPELDRRPGGVRALVEFDPEIGPIVKAETGEEGEEFESSDATSLGLLIDKERRKRRDREEGLRIFYVATTRARDTLVLSTSDAPSKATEAVGLKTLQAKFDLVTGHALNAAPNASIQSVVHVLSSAELPSSGRKHRRARPIPLRGIAKLIETTLYADHQTPPTAPLPPPVYQNLDPCRLLEPSRARLARLVRDLTIDTNRVNDHGIAEAAHMLGRRQFPAANDRLVAQAVERVSVWFSGPLGRALQKAIEVRSDLPFTLIRPIGAERPTIHEGRIDLAYRNADGGWTLVLISDVEADRASEILRARLAGEAAGDLGLSPVTAVWLLRHGPGGSLERVEDA